ncbi:MAG: DedA family protein [Candidatus Moranbacteria bacterium]|nr:DedA family protein [Candidatus Moranbacteria bacterium]
MEHTGQIVFIFLKHYGYWLMLPLMIIEGPIATIFAAMLASLGAFNVWIVLVFSIAGDMIGDMLLYGAGYKWGMGFVHGFGKYLGITENVVLKMEKYFEKHGGKTIFAVKSTTGLCWATFAAAGVVKMNFKKFVKYSFYGGIVWSGFLVAMGYFYGYLWKEIKQYISWVGWIVFVVALVSFAVITLYKRKKSKGFLE